MKAHDSSHSAPRFLSGSQLFFFAMACFAVAAVLIAGLFGAQ